MKIEIDQSGKLENTNISTVVGFSNGKCKTIIISSTEKIKLQKYFRKIGKRQIFVYFSFAATIYLLLKSERNINEICIDIEYPGQTHLIKSFLLQLFLRTKRNIDKNSFHFYCIGRKSKAHIISINAFNLKCADIRITSKDIISLYHKQKIGYLMDA